jgi:hypothetical protein
VVTFPDRVSWVVLVHRVPREPSAPRIAIWRRLRTLGVAQLADGVCALPEDARTREQLEWVADQVQEAGGTALLFHAETFSAKDERRVVSDLAATRAVEYAALSDKVRQAMAGASDVESERRRLLKGLRRELRMIQRRDHFPPPDRDVATALVARLAQDWASLGSDAVVSR